MTFRNEHLSYSRIAKYERCPRSFASHYIDGKRGAASAPMVLGSTVHAALETAVKSGSVTQAGVTQAWWDAWADSGLTHEDSLRGLNMCRAFADQWSSPEVIGVEVAFRFGVGGGRYVIGYIDRVDRLDAETVEVIDYKSGMLIPSRDELEHDLQLAIYSIAARGLYGAKRVVLTHHLLRYGLKVSVERTYEADLATVEYLRAVGPRTERGPYEPRVNTYCPSCPARHDCVAYADAISHLPEIDAVPEERERLAAIAKIATTRKAEVDAIIKAGLETDETVTAGAKTYTLKPTRRTWYDVLDVIDVLQMWGMSRDEVVARVATISTSKLKALVESLPPGAADAVATVARETISQRMVEVRK